MNRVALGIDLGGTKIAAGLVDESGTVLARDEVVTPAAAGAAAILAAASRLAADVRGAAAAGVECVGAALGTAGVVDPVSGRVVSATAHLSGWRGSVPAQTLQDTLALPVAVVNDAHAHAAGEAWLGAGRGAETVLLVAVGTGIGGALVVGGVPLLGAHGAAGHIGHIPVPEAAGVSCACGGSGHVEAVASGSALPAVFAAAGGRGASTARDTVALAQAGDPVALAAVQRAASGLGSAVGGLVNTFDPDVVVFSGGVSRAGEPWWSAVQAATRAAAMPALASVRLTLTELGQEAGIIGAARVAFVRAGVRGE